MQVAGRLIDADSAKSATATSPAAVAVVLSREGDQVSVTDFDILHEDALIPCKCLACLCTLRV